MREGFRLVCTELYAHQEQYYTQMRWTVHLREREEIAKGKRKKQEKLTTYLTPLIRDVT
jgi:predicted AAA+ superfamily ATPase